MPSSNRDRYYPGTAIIFSRSTVRKLGAAVDRDPDFWAPSVDGENDDLLTGPTLLKLNITAKVNK